jgi:hypothetical protein
MIKIKFFQLNKKFLNQFKLIKIPKKKTFLLKAIRNYLKKINIFNLIKKIEFI